ncbi:hypothetical protein CCHL11_00092 [Colletotrichum chlorophyti]|uniref:C6 zinc finger domain containing protein n=1 Tax=Colletotrichum chlorophyti TaxID=708187 RepID=A0A1Q8RUD6_9PEZI|nr:hypothetical protein CCHL11_00092 [Colletotrichum chlorophyti]
MSSFDTENLDLWVPGGLQWEQLNFTSNCDAWGRWLAAMLQPDPWEDSKTTRGISIELSMILYGSAMPPGYNTTYYEVGLWFTYNMYHTEVPANGSTPAYWAFSPRFSRMVFTDPKTRCQAQFCKAVGYTGNQDLCGIGVVASYYLEAILGTMYLVAFTIHQIRRHVNANIYQSAGSTKKQGFGGRILDSFRGSLDMFLGGAMLIAVAMLVASVYASITSRQERKQPNPELPSGEAVYEMALALIASNFSVFPVMLLYALVKHDGHRKWLHRSVLFLLWGLSAAVVYLAPRAEIDYDERKSGRQNFDCDQRGSQYWHVVKATQFLVIALPLLWLLITVFVTTGFKIPGMVDKPWVRRWRSCWRLLVAWVNLCVMWGILGYFTHFRQKIINAAGGLDKNDKWTFGQVLALAAWVPVVAELIYILIFGLEDGLSGHMPADYHATHLTPSDSNVHGGVALLSVEQHDTKHHSVITVASTMPPPSMPPAQTGWHATEYQPIDAQQPHVQHHQTWDGYYRTGW